VKVLAILMAALSAPTFAVRRRYPSGVDVPLAKLVGLDEANELDLPCPWCQSPTTEVDAACTSCGRRFGSI
jgi:hypothetical protein